MRTLCLPLKAVYFDQIANGEKRWEYRLCTAYWHRRLLFVSYSHVLLTKGYPKREDMSRRMLLPWRGYRVETIQHPHFGPLPVEVYAIQVAPDA